MIAGHPLVVWVQGTRAEGHDHWCRAGLVSSFPSATKAVIAHNGRRRECNDGELRVKYRLMDMTSRAAPAFISYDTTLWVSDS